MTLLIAAALFTIAGIVAVRFNRSVNAAHRDIEEAETRVLLKTGLALSGGVLGAFKLRGNMEGVEIELANGAGARQPGSSEVTVSACAVRIAVPIADQIVCKLDEIDQIMGVLPAAPRVRTGHAQFDATYAVFVMSTGDTNGGSYRGGPDTTPILWAQSSLLDRLLELDLLWLRVRDGFADVVFPRLPPEDVGRAAVLASAVACAAQRTPIPTLLAGPRGRWLEWEHEVIPVFLSLSAILILGCTGGPWAAQLNIFKFLDDEFICGHGDQMVPGPSDDALFDLQCLDHPEKSIALHWAGGISLFISAVTLGIVLLSVWYYEKYYAASRATRLSRSRSLLATGDSVEVRPDHNSAQGNEG